MVSTLPSTARNWLTLTASVAAAPAATFVRRRSWLAEPSETSPAALAAAIPVAPKPAGANAALDRSAVVVEFAPNATLLATVAAALLPNATAPVAAAI